MSSLKKAKLSSTILIIGSGLAGYTLVREVRKLNPTVSIRMITADDGAYYSKPQLSTALTHQKSPDKLALFDKDKAASQFNIEISSNTKILRIDPQAKCCYSEDESFYYEKLIMATGAKPIILSGLEDALHVNDLQDYAVFREAILNKKHIGIVGSGLVGCEFANDLHNAGYQVSVISQDTYPLARLVPEAAGLKMIEAFANLGMEWHLGKAFEPQVSFPFDCLLSAVGLKPDLTLAKAAKLETHRGIVVDDYLKTSEQDIYALGDCAEIHQEVMLFVAPLTVSARALAKSLTGENTKVQFPVMPIYIKTPSYPIVTLPPKNLASGEWEIEEKDGNVKALFYDEHGELSGFTLTGKFTADTMNVMKLVVVGGVPV